MPANKRAEQMTRTQPPTAPKKRKRSRVQYDSGPAFESESASDAGTGTALGNAVVKLVDISVTFSAIDLRGISFVFAKGAKEIHEVQIVAYDTGLITNERSKKKLVALFSYLAAIATKRIQPIIVGEEMPASLIGRVPADATRYTASSPDIFLKSERNDRATQSNP